MGTKVGRVALFGIPLQQTWSYGNTGDFAPTYYLQTDAPLYYYSFTDAFIAMAYRSLTQDEQARFDPMITGFNPADMYAADHIKRVLQTFPGVFSGIGEFTIHKEFVSAKIAGETASLVNPALDRILDFAGEAGLVVILHNDVDMPFPKPGQDPYQAAQLGALFRRHPKTTIIWAHCGLGRIVRPVKDQLAIVDRALSDPALAHVSIDISWDEVAKYLVATPETIQATADLINRHPDRFLFGTDEVAPTEQAKYLKVYDMYAPLFAKLTPEASEKVRKGNYERLFDQARVRVRQWEKANPEVNKEEIVKETRGPAGRIAVVALAAGRIAARGAAPRHRGDADADPEPGPAPARQARHRTRGHAGPRRRRKRSRGSTSTASPCSTWATRPSRTTRTGSTWCGRPSCPRSRTSTARTGTSSPASGRAASASRASSPPSAGEIKTIFEFELFGTGVDAGQTTFRLRHAWGELGPGRRGPDLEPVHGPRRVPELDRVLGPERHGVLPQRPAPLDALVRRATRASRSRSSGRAPAPTRATSRTASSSRTSRAASRCPTSPRTTATRGDWGHVQLAGIVRQMKWDDLNTDQFDLAATPPAGAST